MRKAISIKTLVITILILITIRFVFPTWTPPIEGYPDSISTLKQVEINGTKLELMIRGYNKNNPVIIFIHGGPGCSEIPYVKKYQDLLEKNFTIVQYDQRGAGKSYHFVEDYKDLSVELLVEDLVGITDYISNQLDTLKIILVGHSFGTVIGIKTAQKIPEKYLAYVGIGQVGDFWQGELEDLQYCLNQARLNNNFNDINKIEKYRKGIIDKEESFPRYYTRKYGGAARQLSENIDIAKGVFLSTEYNWQDAIRYLIGMKISNDKLWIEIKNTNLPRQVNKLKIPCYFVTGKYDYMTPAKSAEDYLNLIDAPKKCFILFIKSAHYPHFEEKKDFNELMCNIYQQL
jgi:pimeloyl-ACP methyl ester carboxylesterase